MHKPAQDRRRPFIRPNTAVSAAAVFVRVLRCRQGRWRSQKIHHHWSGHERVHVQTDGKFKVRACMLFADDISCCCTRANKLEKRALLPCPAR